MAGLVGSELRVVGRLDSRQLVGLVEGQRALGLDELGGPDGVVQEGRRQHVLLVGRRVLGHVGAQQITEHLLLGSTAVLCRQTASHISNWSTG